MSVRFRDFYKNTLHSSEGPLPALHAGVNVFFLMLSRMEWDIALDRKTGLK